LRGFWGRCNRTGMHVAVSRDLWFNLHRIACGRGQPGRVEVREWEGYVPVHFNHLAVAAKDKQQSARFLKDLLGLPEPTSWGPFLSLTLDDGIRLDYAEPGVEFPGQHYALLVSDDVFDRAVERIKANGVPFWAGPGHTGRDQHQPRRPRGLFRRPGRASL
jgi:catechol 2,3-dioxygenase-like lactoylglutathione lyase family enzyme